jgi:hypothetical protein
LDNNKADDDDDDDDDADMNCHLAAIENKQNTLAPASSLPRPSLQPLCNPRLKELKKRDSFHSPQSPNGDHRMSIGTSDTESGPNSPGVVKTPLWLKPKGYRPTSGEEQQQLYSVNIDVENAMEYFKTPDGAAARLAKASHKPETPLDELFTNAIHIAKENSKNPKYYTDIYQSPDVVYNFESNPRLKDRLDEIRNKANARVVASRLNNGDNGDDDDDEAMMMSDDLAALAATQPPKKQILKNVHVYVCKRFQKEQVKFYDLVVELGGNFLWNYNAACTHFIYTGRIDDDNDNELKTAKRESKIIVAPEWLSECKSQNVRVNEALYLIGKYIAFYPVNLNHR